MTTDKGRTRRWLGKVGWLAQSLICVRVPCAQQASKSRVANRLGAGGWPLLIYPYAVHVPYALYLMPYSVKAGLCVVCVWLNWLNKAGDPAKPKSQLLW